jgi:putative transposase
VVTPAAKREAVAHACAVHGVSERRACRILGVDRASMRYRSLRVGDSAVRRRIRALARKRRRFGYRRLHVLLRREGYRMNHKRFRRLYREEKLQVRQRGARKRALGVRAPLALPSGPNERWSLDFVSDCFSNGRRFRILAIVDDFTRESLALIPETSLSGVREARADLASWRVDYNGVRPHSALANRTPEEFRAQHIAVAGMTSNGQNFNPGLRA